MTSTQELNRRLKTAKANRAVLNNQYELIARFVRFRKYGFIEDYTKGDFFVHGDVYSSAANRACHIAASAILGALWKNGARTFYLSRPRQIEESEEVKEYYEEANRRLIEAMEDPAAGLEVALDEYMNDQLSFGTSGVAAFHGPQNGPLLDFKCWDLKGLYIEIDAMGRVKSFFYCRKLNAMQVAEEYGEDKLTDKMKPAFEKQDTETKFEIATYIGPRASYDPSKSDMLNRAYESVHFTTQEGATMRESGYDELPCKICRFYKNVEEDYGRSPAMEALPDIIELNAVVELLHQTAETNLRPALAILDDGTFGGGTIDLSAGAVNVLNISQRTTAANPIFPIPQSGELNSTIKLKEMLEESVAQHFFLDRLLDLNNSTRMTLGEAQIRNEIRADAMGGTYARQINEMFTPLIERCVNLLWEIGHLGVYPGSEQEQKVLARGEEPLYIPEAVAEAISKGQPWYKINYVSPAARIMRSEELRGIMTELSIAAQYASIMPELTMRLDPDKVSQKLNELSGSTPDIHASDEVFQERMAAHKEMQGQIAAMQAAAQQAGIRKANAGAAQSEAQAQATMMGAMS